VVSLLLAPLLVGLIVGIVYTKPWWWPSQGYSPPTAAGRVLGFVGGCEAFRLHAQYRWPPFGAVKRAAPSVLAAKVGGFDPNEYVAVNGWVHAEIAYPHNPPPFNNDIWFHVADDSGWVSFGAVRSLPTSPAATNFDEDGGTPAVAPPQCEGAVR
jgi:hypothetical protein